MKNILFLALAASCTSVDSPTLCGQPTVEADFSDLNGTNTQDGAYEICEAIAWHAVSNVDTCLHPPKPNYTVPCPSYGLRQCDGCGDADCVSFDVQGFEEEPYCYCFRQCGGDDDCGGIGSCMCAHLAEVGGQGTSSRCVSGDCESDNDCGAGERCMVPTADPTWSHHCTKPVDECEPERPCTSIFDLSARVCRYDDDRERYRCYPSADPSN